MAHEYSEFVNFKTMDLYTKEMFEIALKRNKNRILVRNGEFVGLFKYLPYKNEIILTKKINKNTHGFTDKLKVYDNGKHWGTGGSNGISAIIRDCNEAH